MTHYLFYITENYSFEILRPLQQEIQRRGDQVKWLVGGNNVNLSNFSASERQLSSIKEAVEYNPSACFVPGNLIPNFIPGLKVQVFHGLEWKKKGHFQIRGFFDLYCTHGEATTARFKQLAEKFGYFDVVETGWPKIDPLFNTSPAQFFETDKPVILYAPTFSPKLTSAQDLFNEIKAISQLAQYNWLIKFHPKMDETWVKQYSALSRDNFKVVNTANINELFQSADILLSDTSSVIGEFSLLAKPVITYKNSQPGPYLIDINTTDALSPAIEQALSPTKELLKSIEDYCQKLHPYKDGLSSVRILNVVENIAKNGKQSKKHKPLNLFRTLKLRNKLNYWRW